MRYHKITSPDINNGLGFRVTLWLSGCSLNCKFCHNPETHDPLSGKLFDENSLNKLLEELSKSYISGLTISGGNPFESDHEELFNLLRLVKNKFPDKNIWVFSGYTLEESMKDPSLVGILDLIDVLVDGRFDFKQRDISLAFRGSRNQVIWEKDPHGIFIKSNLN